jgi:hypothetical protein
MCAFNEIWMYMVQSASSGIKIFIRPQFYCNFHTGLLPSPAITTWMRHKLLFKYPFCRLPFQVSTTEW